MQKLLFIGFGLWASFCPAKDISSDNLKIYLQKGLEKAFAIKNQDMKFVQAQMLTDNAWADLLPKLNLSMGQSETLSESLDSEASIAKESTTYRSASIGATWTLWDNYQNIRNITLAKLYQEQSQIETNSLKQTFALNFIEAYLAYQVALNKKESLSIFLEQAKWSHEQSQLLVKLGARNEMDSLDAEVEYLNAQRDLMEFENSLLAAKQRLQIILSCEECQDFGKIDLLSYKPYYIEKFIKFEKNFKKENLDVLFEKNPQIRKNKLDLDSNFESLKQTKMGYWPETSISLTHTYDFSRQIETVPTGGARVNLNSTVLSLNLSWTFWDWFTTKRKIDSSELSYKISSNQFKEKIQEIRAEILLTYNQLNMANKSIEISSLALAKAEKQINFSKELYKIGKINLIALQQSMSRYLNARISHSERLKDKYVLMAKSLTLVNENILP